MRIALITIDDADGEDGLVLGQPVSQHQLEFAVHAGCDAVIVMGDAHSSSAFRLRHAAENYGIKFRAVSVTHNLLGAIGVSDEIIVFERNILTANSDVLARLTSGNAIVTVAADPGVSLGYERIDAANAWAGVMRLPGRLVEHLAQLPRDCEPAAALLRIALQAKILSHNMESQALGDGSWQRVELGTVASAEGRLIDRRLGNIFPGDVTGWIANRALRTLAKNLFRQKMPAKVCAGISVILAFIGVSAAFYGIPVAGFLAVVLAAVFARVSSSLRQLIHIESVRSSIGNKSLSLIVDVALTICGVGAVDNGVLQAAFPALILFALLHTLPIAGSRFYSRLFHDRAVLGVLFAGFALFGYLIPAIMGASLLLLGDAKYRAIKEAV